MKPFLFKRGNIYQLQYFDEREGRKKRVSAKCTTKSDALKFLIEFEKNILNKPRVTYKSLTAFSEEYKKHVKLNLSHKYFLTVESTFRIFLQYIGEIPLSKLSTQLMENFLSSVKSKHQARKHYINLKSAFNKAIAWEYLTINPLNKIKPPKIPRNNPRFITEAQLQMIMDQESNRTLKLIYFFAFHTGMRLGEIVNLRWTEVYLPQRIIKVINTPEFTTKGKKERTIPINEKLAEVLTSHIPKIIDPNRTLFTKYSFKFNDDYISKNFKKALKKVEGLDLKIRFHDLRHSFASNLAAKGVSLFIIKELLGHRDISTTQIYSHLTIESLRNAVKVLE